MSCKINFKQWLETSLRDMIKPVSQSPVHHAEGDVFLHTMMVRKQLNDAINHFKELASDKNSVFGNFDPVVTKEEMNLLRIAAWMHDIGKASATTIGGKPWKENEPGSIKAIGHEDPEHFEPMMKQLGQPWQNMYQKASPEDKEDLWFAIKHHMSLKDTGFGRNVLAQLMGDDGKFKNDRKTKLLLILIMMDQTGRLRLGKPKETLPEISNKMNQSATDYYAKKIKNANKPPAPDDPRAFLDILRSRNLTDNQVRQAFKGKFGRYPEEI